MPFAYKIRPETVGQYIGLKDRNGTEIYEGDIIEDYDNGRCLWIVEWNNFCGEWHIRDKSHSRYLSDGHMTSVFDEWGVIGNIYANIDLLEVRA